MKHEVLIGQQDYTVLVFIPDSAQTDGSGKTGLVAANLTVSYVRVETDNDVVVTDVTGSLNNLAALTTAHTDWGLLEVSSTLAPGLYRLDIADAVFAAGAWSAVVYVMVTTSAAAASPMEFVMVPNSPLTGVLLAPVTHTSAVIPTVTTTGTATAVTTVNGLAANVITAAATASDFGTEVAGAVWDLDATGHQTTGTFGQAIGDPAADTNTIYGAVVTGAAGATVAADIIAIKTETATILADTNDIQTRLPAALSAGGNIKADVLSLGGVVQSLTDLKDFADDGYDPATNKVQGVVLVDTLTTYTGNTVQTGDSFARIGAAGAGLTAIDLPNQTMDIVGNITGNLSGSVGSVTGAVGSVTAGVTLAAAAIQAIWDALTAALTTVGSIGKLLVDNINATISSRASQTSVDDLPTNAELATSQAAADDATLAAIAALNNISAAAVNAEVVDALATDTYVEPVQGAPAATTSLAAKINYLFKWTRNKKDNDGTTTNFYADNGTTVDHKQTVSEAAGTVTKGEIVTGP